MISRKRTIIQPVKPDGKILDPILVEKGILEQLRDFMFNFTRNVLAVYGIIAIIIWIMG